MLRPNLRYLREFTKLSIPFYVPEIFHNFFFKLGGNKKGGGGSHHKSLLWLTISEAVTIQAAWQGTENHETASQEAWAWHCGAARDFQSLHI